MTARVVNKQLGERVAAARKSLRKSQPELAREIGVSQSAIAEIEGGRIRRPKKLREIAMALGCSEDWLLGETDEPASTSAPQRKIADAHISATKPNAQLAGNVRMDTGTYIPVYGQAMGGRSGEFVLNGNRLADVLAPPSLVGVRDAYAVYVVGDSMEPRYFAGEAVYVNPHLPVRKGDYVVIQVLRDGERHGFVKRFVSQAGRITRVEQHNPQEGIEFDSGDVISIHRIVMAG